jgi:hypothetical protein
MEFVLIGVVVWITLVALAVAMCRISGRADARADGLYASQRVAAGEDVVPTAARIRIPAL